MKKVINVKKVNKGFPFLAFLALFAFLASLAFSGDLEVIGIYHIPKDAYPLAKELGFNAVHVYNDPRYSKKEIIEQIDYAESLGLKVLFEFKTGDFDIREIIGTIESYKHLTGITYWYLADEPDLKGIRPDMISALSKLVKNTDPKSRDTFIVVSPLRLKDRSLHKTGIHTRAYSYYKNSADIIGVNKYTTPRKLRDYLSSSVFPHCKGARWWAITSLRQTPRNLKKSVDMFLKGEPKGLLYYAYADSEWQFNLKDKKDIQDALKEINFKLRGIDPVFVRDTKKESVPDDLGQQLKMPPGIKKTPAKDGKAEFKIGDSSGIGMNQRRFGGEPQALMMPAHLKTKSSAPVKSTSTFRATSWQNMPGFRRPPQASTSTQTQDTVVDQ
ncbi:hypothetical protein ACFL6Y_04040 [Elusimicrobiota bacterium]